MAGRPKEFRREDVLSDAMDVFWRKGFLGTSIKDLEESTGLGRQSLYNEFQDKEQLFLAAIDHYDLSVTQQAIEILSSEGSAKATIRKWYESLIEVATSKDRRGCMLTNSTMCVEISDDRMHEAMKAITKKLENAIATAVTNARRQGELSTEESVSTIASYFLATAQGLLVMGRMGNSSASLRRIATMSLNAYLR